MRKLILVLLALCGLMAGEAFSQIPADGGGLRGEVASPTALAGQWKEFWDSENKATDVNYNDLYRITVQGTKIDVAITSREQPIRDVAYLGDELSFVLHTSFDVRYVLRLQPDGRWLEGTATTPKKTVPIRWEKVGAP